MASQGRKVYQPSNCTKQATPAPPDLLLGGADWGCLTCYADWGFKGFKGFKDFKGFNFPFSIFNFQFNHRRPRPSGTPSNSEGDNFQFSIFNFQFILVSLWPISDRG